MAAPETRVNQSLIGKAEAIMLASATMAVYAQGSEPLATLAGVGIAGSGIVVLFEAGKRGSENAPPRPTPPGIRAIQTLRQKLRR